VAVFVASASPLDQFIMNDPEWFFRKSAEEARINPDNPYILTDHVKCAAFELPFTNEELGMNAAPEAAPPVLGAFGPGARDVLEYLEEEGVVRHTGAKWHWADRSFPAEGISLRSALADNVVIVDVTQGRNAVIGEMDRPSAKELIFKNAVYMHRGRQYLVESLDIANRKCLVREAEVNYFTDGLVKTDIKVLTEDETLDFGSCGGVLGDVLVRSQVAKFKKIRFHTHENVGYGDIDLPEEEMQTRSLALLFGKTAESGPAPSDSHDSAAAAVLSGAGEDGSGSILAGAGTLIKHMAPVFLLCDPRDLGVAERVRDPHFGAPALYIYDKYPGGTGLAESLARHTGELFRSIYRVVAECPCKEGCPSCVGPGENKRGTAEFLQALLPESPLL
jgi:DEAD/DEAH box helicase domain-containing protein